MLLKDDQAELLLELKLWHYYFGLLRNHTLAQSSGQVNQFN